MYYHHFSQIVADDQESHLNTSFKHFYYFITEFNLVEKKEMVPLSELIANLTGRDKKSALAGDASKLEAAPSALPHPSSPSPLQSPPNEASESPKNRPLKPNVNLPLTGMLSSLQNYLLLLLNFR